VDKRVLLRHTGTYVFDWAAQERLRQDFANMAPPVITKVEMTPQGGHTVPQEVLDAEPVAEVVAHNSSKPETAANPA
jgi:hypothetical protein